jgi:phytoene/squalene synthetase
MAARMAGGVTTDTLFGPTCSRRLMGMEDRLSKSEIRKDALQETAQSVASTVGEVASIVTTAVKDVAGAIGGLATDVFEIRDGVRRADKRTDDTME